MEDTFMETTEKITKKHPFYKKLLGVCLIAAAALYCIPELREALCSKIELLTNEWRNRYDEQQG